MAIYLCSSCLSSDDRMWLDGTSLMAGVCVRCDGLGHFVLRDAILDPHLAKRHGSPVSSSDHRVEVLRPFVWDVNGYYRDLGCLPGASRRELVAAYRALGPNPPPRQTYCLKQLLNKAVRELYDRCQPGQLFFDEELRQVVLRRAAEERSRAIRAGVEDPESDMGQPDLSDALNKAVQVLDTDEVLAQDGDAIEWGYYLWNSHRGADLPLMKWRTMLIESLWRRGIVRSIGIGYRGSQAAVTVHQVDGVDVVFLGHETEPTHQAAECAVDIIQQGA